MMRLVFALSALTVTTSAHAGCSAIVNATVHAPDGPVTSATVVWDEGVITSVSADSSAAKGCEVVDAQGAPLTAGFIEVDTQLGVVEVGLEGETRDGDAGSESIRSGFQVTDAYNPRSSLIPIQRIGGVTRALVVPAGGRISGQAGHVRLSGASQMKAVVDAGVAMWANLDGSSSAQALRELRQALQDARDWPRLKAAYDRGQVRPLAASANDLEALGAVIRGDIPLVIKADRASDIEAILRFADEQKIRVVIDGGAEAWLVAEALAEASVAVIVDPMVYGSGSFDQLHGRADNPALLDEAGVTVILSTHSTHNARNLGQYAGNAVRGGMSHEAALKAITEAPANVFGLNDVGIVAPGAAADLVLWSGDPLEVRSWPEGVWIDGDSIELVSRQTELRDAYLDLPGTPKSAPALPKAP